MGTHRLAMKLPTSLALLVGVVAWVGISSALPVPGPRRCVEGAKDVDCSDDASGGKIGDGMEPLKTKIGTIIKVRDLKVDDVMKSEDQAEKPSHASDYTEDDEITEDMDEEEEGEKEGEEEGEEEEEEEKEEDEEEEEAEEEEEEGEEMEEEEENKEESGNAEEEENMEDGTDADPDMSGEEL